MSSRSGIDKRGSIQGISNTQVLAEQEKTVNGTSRVEIYRLVRYGMFQRNLGEFVASTFNLGLPFYEDDEVGFRLVSNNMSK